MTLIVELGQINNHSHSDDLTMRNPRNDNLALTEKFEALDRQSRAW